MSKRLAQLRREEFERLFEKLLSAGERKRSAMRACPRCNNTAVIEDGYCGVCREGTMPSLAAPPCSAARVYALHAAMAEARFLIAMLGRHPTSTGAQQASAAAVLRHIEAALPAAPPNWRKENGGKP